MDYKLKNRDGVETTYAKDKIKIPAATGDNMVVFTQGEAQAEKTMDINANGAFTVEPDAGFSFVRKVSGTVNVSTPEPVLQEKAVNITSNGQTSVTPDAGKDGLSKVDITVSVPPTSGFQLKAAISTYGAAMQNENFINIVGQAVFGTLEPPSGWDIPMFPLCIGLNVNSKAVYCWCSSIVDGNTGVALFPGCFYVDGKQGYLEFKFYTDSDNNPLFEITRLELGGENIISQITNSSFIIVATLFSGNT